jgi:predicted RNase H-like HicB family nuclease
MRVGSAASSVHADAGSWSARKATQMIAATTPLTRLDEQDRGTTLSNRHESSLRQVMLVRGEDGSWVAECPSLPGCYGEGQTREQAIEDIKESIASHLAELEAWGLVAPEERFEALIVAI